MSEWEKLLAAFLAGDLSEAAFHDRFLALWRLQRDSGLPPAIERLFYVVEAFSPLPHLRDPGQPWEADSAELRAATRQALFDLRERDGRCSD